MAAYSNVSVSINGDTSFVNNTCIDGGGEDLNAQRLFKVKFVSTLQSVENPDKVGRFKPVSRGCSMAHANIDSFAEFQSIDWDNKHH